jgi:transposase
MMDTIGIDISKDALDAYWLSKRQHKQFANTKAGLGALVCWIRRSEVSLVVFEATVSAVK